MDGSETLSHARRSLPVVGSPAPPAPRVAAPRSVRISLTDRCDLACVYCRPSRSDGYFEERLDDDGWKAMVRALVASGVRRVRITGGEPLLHPRVVALVGFIAGLGVDDLALTTNATLLAGLARPLRAAGLKRLTVSLDSLRADRFFRITRGGSLERVLAGIDAAIDAGYPELKTNTVVLRDENDDELPDIVRWAWARGIVPRFIELMRIGAGAQLSARALVPAGEIRARLAHLLEDAPWAVDADRGPARYVRALGGGGARVGFITGSTDTYCDSCDRLRVASDGTIRPCLATSDGVPAMALAKAGDTPALGRAIDDAWALKPQSGWKGCTEPSAATLSIRAIGG
jgi:cyclic pyranopterin phosphate synthase